MKAFASLVVFATWSAICVASATVPDSAGQRGATTPQPSRPTPPSNLAADIAATEKSLGEARAESALYASGLVKAVIEIRAAVLAQTLAMLQQKAAAQSNGITMRFSVDGRAFAPPTDAARQIADVETEVQKLKGEILAQQAEADRYSGGLVQAMALSTVATSRNSLAMLEQKRLALKYSLPQYIGFAESPATRLPAPPAQAPAIPNARRTAPLFEIVSVDSRVTESNEVWWRYAWKLTLRNTSAAPALFRATIEFQDKEGFIIDTDTARDLSVAAGAEETFTGSALISLPGARNVGRTNAKVERVR